MFFFIFLFFFSIFFKNFLKGEKKEKKRGWRCDDDDDENVMKKGERGRRKFQLIELNTVRKRMSRNFDVKSRNCFTKEGRKRPKGWVEVSRNSFRFTKERRKRVRRWVFLWKIDERECWLRDDHDERLFCVCLYYECQKC